MRRATVLSLALLLLPGVATPAEKVRVGVRFTLAEPSYRAELADADIARLEAEAAKLLARWLGRRIGYLAFGPTVSGGGPAPVLAFRLDVRSASGEGLLKEVGFHATLVDAAGTPVPRTGRPFLRFRPEDKYDRPIGSVESLLKEMEVILATVEPDGLARDVLSAVPVTNVGRLWKDPLGWLIPHRQDDLCVAPETTLSVESLVPTGAGTLRARVRAKAQAPFDPPQLDPQIEMYREMLFSEIDRKQIDAADLARLEQAAPDRVKVVAVYVIEYQPLQPCGPLVTDAPEPGGGS